MGMGRLKPFACQWEMSGRCSDPHIFVHHPPNALPPSTLGRLLKNATPADPLSSRAQNPLSWPALARGTWLWPTQPINWSADQLTPIPPTQLTAIRKSEKLIQFFVASKKCPFICTNFSYSFSPLLIAFSSHSANSANIIRLAIFLPTMRCPKHNNNPSIWILVKLVKPMVWTVSHRKLFSNGPFITLA